MSLGLLILQVPPVSTDVPCLGPATLSEAAHLSGCKSEFYDVDIDLYYIFQSTEVFEEYWEKYRKSHPHFH
jgi:hypothetical protein